MDRPRLLPNANVLDELEKNIAEAGAFNAQIAERYNGLAATGTAFALAPNKPAISWGVRIGDVECRFEVSSPDLPEIDAESRDVLLKAEKSFFEAVAKAMPPGSRVDLTLTRREK